MKNIGEIFFSANGIYHNFPPYQNECLWKNIGIRIDKIYMGILDSMENILYQ